MITQLIMMTLVLKALMKTNRVFILALLLLLLFVVIDSECRRSPNSGLLRLRIWYGCCGLAYTAIIIIIITIIIILTTTITINKTKDLVDEEEAISLIGRWFAAEPGELQKMSGITW